MNADPVRFYDVDLNSRLLVGTAQYPSPAILAEALAASRADMVTVSLAPRGRGRPRRRKLLGPDPRARPARAAQHRRLPHGQGSGDDRPYGARPVRHQLDQAGGDRRGGSARARRVRPGRGGAHPLRRRFLRVSLYNGRSGGGRQAARRRLPSADALGRADRVGPGAQQSVRLAGACAPISPMCRW